MSHFISLRGCCRPSGAVGELRFAGALGGCAGSAIEQQSTCRPDITTSRRHAFCHVDEVISLLVADAPSYLRRWSAP